MFRSYYRLLFVILLSLALFAGIPNCLAASPGQKVDSQEKGKEKVKGKKDKKDDSAKGTEKEKLTKQEREYQKILQYSQDRYANNPEFRAEVEEVYRQKLREHSELAFQINTRDARDMRISDTGDKLKAEKTLYNNPLVMDYVNRVGQSLVPKDSTRLYAFKVVLNPIPEAHSLSTGTVYISTGLLSLVDNEAQLSYILGHEIGHIEKVHWHQDVLVHQGLDEYNEKQQKKRRIIGGVLGIGLGAVSGGLLNTSPTAAFSLLAAQSAVPTIMKISIPNAVVSWDKAQEDEADQLALDYMLQRNYDPREVPKFYASLQRTTKGDKRAELGFMADATRVVERVQQVDTLVGGMGNLFSSRTLMVGAINLAAMQQVSQITAPSQSGPAQKVEPDKKFDPSRDAARRKDDVEQKISKELAAIIDAKLDAGELVGSSAEFQALMAELKRDNGIRAYYYDMFQMARDNLEESLRIRSNDPQAHFYYGKVLKLTARNATEKSHALASFVRAIELDKRSVLPEAYLHRALAMIESKDASQMAEIVSNLKAYIEGYQREHAGSLPENIAVIYDYMQEAGEIDWAARPATNISTKNIDAIVTASLAPVVKAEPPAPAPAVEPPPPPKPAPVTKPKPVKKP